MKTILDNTDLISAWLGLPPACRKRLIEMKEKGLHFSAETLDFFHYTREVSSYLMALYDGGHITQTQRSEIYKIITEKGGEK